MRGIFGTRLIGIFACAVLLLSSISRPAISDTAAQGQWRTINDSGIALEYQSEYESTARDVLPVLVKLLKEKSPLESSISAQASLNGMAAHRSEYLQFIASAIGLTKPGKNMSETYDSVVQMQREIASKLQGVRRFRLWEDSALKQALSRGESIPGFSYDPASDQISFNWQFTLGGKAGSDLPERLKCLPLGFSQGDSAQGIADRTTSALSDYAGIVGIILAPWIAFHESAEAGILMDFGVSTAFRRWFCDGAAQMVAEQGARKYLGESVYDGMKTLYNTASPEALRPEVDLLAWRGMEWEECMPNCPGMRLSSAHYGFAFREMRSLVERHGYMVISQILKQLAKTPAKDRDSKAIFAAIKSASGEDMEARLSQYGKEAKDDFRGLAIRDLEFAAVDLSHKKAGKPVELASGAKVALDGKHDIQVSLSCETLDAPASMRFQIAEASDLCHADARLNGKGATDLTLDLGLPKLAAQLKSGDYHLQALFNGKVFMEMPVSLIVSN